MTKNTAKSVTRNVEAGCYAIRIKEQINSTMLVWFEGFSIQSTDVEGTILTGSIADQSALHGLLAKIRDLNLTLISVNRIDPKEKQP